jgi:hypothetical protein
MTGRKAKRNATITKCSFTSEWDDGSIVTTDCIYNETTGEVTPAVSKGQIPTGSLIDEYITLNNGDEIPVCPDCHSYVMKTVVGDRRDLSYGEYKVCSDPDCTGDEEG